MSLAKRSFCSINSLRKERSIIFYSAVFGLAFLIIWVCQPLLWPGGFGFRADESVTITTEEIDPKTKNKVTTITKSQGGKTLWDWLNLLGVPLSLLILGFVLEQLRQQRDKEADRIQRRRDEEAAKEEVLQTYFDRLSTLLIDQNIFEIAAKNDYIYRENWRGIEIEHSPSFSNDQQVLLEAAIDVIRARTLSILRRFEDDSRRKTSVIRFLIEAEVIQKLGLELSNFELSRVDLRGVDFSEVDLRGAKLIQARLSGSKLIKANLSGADLSDAELDWADLSFTDLRYTKLSGADLCGAKLIAADLSEAELNGTKLLSTELSRANLNNIKFDNQTVWPRGLGRDSNAPRNISNKLKEFLGL
jgi:hypothetical protein